MTLKELRESQGLSQGEMGKILCRSAATILDYEKGRMKIPDDVYAKIYESFHVRIDVQIESPELMDGATLKEIRLAYGLSQSEMGKIIVRSQHCVLHYEKGVIKVPADVACRLRAWVKENSPDKASLLKKLRLSQGLTQREMGEVIGTSSYVIRDYEKGRRKIPDEVYTMVEEKFHVDIRPGTENSPWLDHKEAVRVLT